MKVTEKIAAEIKNEFFHSAEYADYHHAMAQHAAALSNNNQLHPAMAQIPMLSAAGLNLTVSGTHSESDGILLGREREGERGREGDMLLERNQTCPRKPSNHKSSTGMGGRTNLWQQHPVEGREVEGGCCVRGRGRERAMKGEIEEGERGNEGERE